MTATSYISGRKIEFNGIEWVYSDTKESIKTEGEVMNLPNTVDPKLVIEGKIKDRIKTHEITIEKYQKLVDEFRLNTNDPEHATIGMGLLFISTSQNAIIDLELMLEVIEALHG